MDAYFQWLAEQQRAETQEPAPRAWGKANPAERPASRGPEAHGPGGAPTRRRHEEVGCLAPFAVGSLVTHSGAASARAWHFYLGWLPWNGLPESGWPTL